MATRTTTRLSRGSHAASIMFDLISEYLREAKVEPHLPNIRFRREYIEELDLIERDLFSLLYSTVQPEILPGSDTVTKVMSAMADSNMFRTLRTATVLDPTNSAMGMIGLMEVLAVSQLRRADTIDTAIQGVAKSVTLLSDMAARLEPQATGGVDLGATGGAGGDDEGSSGSPEGPDMKSLLDRRIILAAAIRANPRMTQLFSVFGRVEEIKSSILDDLVDGDSGSTTIDQGGAIELADTGYLATRSLEMLAQELADETLEIVTGEAEGGEGLGPVLVMLDRSGSMREQLDKRDEMKGNRMDLGLAIAYNLMESCRASRRRFVLVPFATRVAEEQVIRSDENGICGINGVQNLLRLVGSGGTDFTRAASRGIRILQEDGMKNADMVWITDGRDTVADDNQGAFNELVRVKSELDSKGARAFVLNFCESGYPMRILAGAGPFIGSRVRGRDRYLSKVPESDHKSRLFENFESLEEIENGISSILREIMQKETGLDWLNR